MRIKSFAFIALLLISSVGHSQQNDIAVIAYYTGGADDIENFPVEKLTHIIYSFAHLEGNKLHVSSAQTPLIKKLVSLKETHPRLKILLSLGGWGGCKTCSDVFSTEKGRTAFANSVKETNSRLGTDGIDLDWEYPAIEGYPGHTFKLEDKQNFTALVAELRRALGEKSEISFAAGGFRSFIDSSIEWRKVMPLVDRVNVMTYDLVNGNSAVTGHHTPLYSTGQNPESIDNAVNNLAEQGVPREKIVVGSAFYGRMWENVSDPLNGLYRQGKFKQSITSRNLSDMLSSNGFVSYWDSTAQSPYSYSPVTKQFITYDDKRSIKLKTEYVIDNGLGGIMFWQLRGDTYSDGLLGEIYDVKSTYTKGKK